MGQLLKKLQSPRITISLIAGLVIIIAVGLVGLLVFYGAGGCTSPGGEAVARTAPPTVDSS